MIKETLANAISSLSKKHNVHKNELRIKISKPNNKLNYEIMKNGDVIEETNLATALNINTITAFIVSTRLETIIINLSKEYKIPESNINVRIYTKSEDCSPMLYLFDGVTPKSPLDVDTLI
jgi:hypothetical protein